MSATEKLTNDIIAYESGSLNEQETIEMFQRLVDTGLAWKLQGHYGRAARDLIEGGLVIQKKEVSAPVEIMNNIWKVYSDATRG